MKQLERTLAKYLPDPAKEGIAYMLGKARMVGADARALPDFIIMGAQRAGSTSLYEYIAQHPEVQISARKEVHFFDIYYERGVSWYRSHFPFRSHLKTNHRITGEASPYYMIHPHCPDRIQNLLPNVKLIFLLRNPVDRAISHYFHEVKSKYETLPIEEAMQREEERIEPELQKMIRNPHYYSFAYHHFSYKKRGVYVEQIEPYLKRFSQEQMLFLQSETLFANTEKVLKEVFGFLNINQDALPQDLNARNAGHYSNKVPENVYRSLADYFTPYNNRLYERLGQDFGW